MSRRSADTNRELGRDRVMDNYAASSSDDLKLTREYEPGELRGSDWEVERDTWSDPSAGSTIHGGSSSRVTERERDRNEVTIALEGFSRTMHATLLSTSAQALAAQHFRRMESFSIPSTGIPSPSLAEAQNRLRAAEVELGERMRELYATFDELMRKTLVSRRTYRTHTAGGSDTERDMQKEGDVARELSKVELDAVRDRMRTLEGRLDEAYPISRKGKERETTGEENGVEHKRSRARLLLEDMSSRLAVIEGLKEDLDTRCNDLEDLVNSRIQDEIEIDRIGNRRWKVFEDLRDPDGVIRGFKRKREGENVSPLNSQDLPPPLDDRLISHTNTDTETNGLVASLQQPVPETRDDRSEIAQLKAQVYSLKTMVSSSININNNRHSDPNPALQKQVEALQTELKQVKDELKSLMDKASADQKALDDLKLHCETFVRAQILHTVAKLAKNPPQNGSGSSSRVSPSSGIPSGLPSITAGVLPIHLTPQDQQQQQRQQPQPHQGGQTRPGQGNQTPTPLSQVLPAAHSGGLAEPSNPNTIGTARSSSHPITQPQREAQVQHRHQPPPTQISGSSTTPTGSHNALAPKHISRSAFAQAQYSSNQSQRSTTPNQQQQLSDKLTTSQTTRPPSPGQVSSLSRSTQASQNQTDTKSNLLAEWVEQRIQRPQLHQQDLLQLQLPQRPPQKYRHVPPQLPAQEQPTPPQSSNPLSSLMQGPRPPHQSAPDGNGNGSGPRFPGIGTPVTDGAEVSGKFVQQMDNAMRQRPGQAPGDNNGDGQFHGS